MPLNSEIIKYFNIKLNITNKFHFQSYVNNVASTILTNINNESLTVMGIKLNKKIWEEINVIK